MDSEAEVFSDDVMRVVNRFLLFCIAVACSAAPTFKLEQGELGGAKYAWIKPPLWNQRVLILAPAFRSASDPLEAKLRPKDPAFQALADDGWLIATTSYRRNGLILADAVTDIDALRAEITRRFGAPDRVVVEGDGMGGMIALLIAERELEEPPLYQGVVAIDPAFETREGFDRGSGLNLQAKIPVIFLSTRHELAAAERYVATPLPKNLRPFKPGLLRVNRDGRGNVNAAEKLFAVKTLDQWLDSATDTLALSDPTKDYLDATVAPEALPSHVFLDPDQHGFTAHITEISAAINGNILLDAQPSDFTAIGIATNAFFRVTIHDHSFRVRFGKDLSTVKRGEWVAFLDADGFYWLSRHQPSATLFTGGTVGDLVHIEAYAGIDVPATREE